MSKELTLKLDINELNTKNTLYAIGSLPRIRILQYLSEKARTISELSTLLECQPCTIRGHLRILENTGIVIKKAGFNDNERVCKWVLLQYHKVVINFLPPNEEV
ncbi:MAG: ArsR family transcriptional regulator [Candidatus Helarchaeota archaeon]